MSFQLPEYTLRDWQYGMVSSVANSILPDSYPRILQNCYTDEFQDNELGNIKGRLGYTIIDAQLIQGQNIRGLHSFLDKTGTTARLIASVNNDADFDPEVSISSFYQRTYYFTAGGVWTEIGAAPFTWTADARMRFTTFLDMVFAVDGTLRPRTWTGGASANWELTNTVNAPKGDTIVNFNDRIHIGKDSILYSSTFPDLDTNTISWENERLPINPDDNDVITALEVNSGILLVFKNRALYTWDGARTESDKLINVGTPSQEAVTTVRGITFFFGETYGSGGVFAYNGQYPTEISRPIRKWIDAIADTDYDDIVSWSSEDHVFFSVGDVTVEGTAFTNIVLRYCVSKDAWSVYSTFDRMTAGTTDVNVAGNRSIVVGDDNGQVHTWNSGNTDNGNPIYSVIRTKELEFGSRYIRKTIQGFALYSNAPQGATVRVRIDGKDWVDLGSLSSPIQKYNRSLKGYFFEFEISHANEGIEPFIFDGFEFFEVKGEPFAT